MLKETTGVRFRSRPSWETLEEFVRDRAQGLIQQILEEEITELLGRGKHERRKPVDGSPGYRNGYGKPRKLALSCGTVEVRRPRVRGLDERFESRVLPLFKRKSTKVESMLPELYLHGLAQGDFELALRGLLGDGAPLSASSIGRLRRKWQAEYDAWKQRDLSDLEVVYLWVDGLYVKAGLEKDKAALLVIIGALSDGRKRVLAVESGQRESTASWASVLRDLKRRGMRAPRLVIGDGHLGLWGALAEIFPEADEQRCWNHKILNVLDRLPKRLEGQAKALLCQIPYAETEAAAVRLRKRFADQYGASFPKAVEILVSDWERMVTFYRYPKGHWVHLRTTNVVESPFAAVRLRTAAAKRYKRVRSATAMIWKLLLVAEKNFRRLKSWWLLPDVAEGAEYRDGVRVIDQPESYAA